MPAKVVRRSPTPRRRAAGGKAYSCPSGYIYRKAYTRKDKDGKTVRVSGGCIKKQGSTAPRTRARQSPKALRRLPAGEKCKPGEIVRDGYVRKAYKRKDGSTVKRTVVKPSCVKDVGRAGKGKREIQKKYKLRKGALRALGYEVKDTESKRRAALLKAVKSGKLPVNSLKWKLNAQYVYRKNAPKGSRRYELGQRFRKDFEYLRKLYPPKSELAKGRKPRPTKAGKAAKAAKAGKARAM